jgi:hypothetical protein
MGKDPVTKTKDPVTKTKDIRAAVSAACCGGSLHTALPGAG